MPGLVVDTLIQIFGASKTLFVMLPISVQRSTIKPSRDGCPWFAIRCAAKIRMQFALLSGTPDGQIRVVLSLTYRLMV
ncbi:hypothetical protein CES85_3773 (plasmid) [Ochrobactrum quorumnocens]|uniref:Uncharacterized protein n=1 Tax=Ochrobactrum quorumnocens TaxID=271865 RepID=A0A248UPG2_9HYPH|nr:hypothetical protein CES85_3773 [[Ochrobactrum] quorumnocens]